MGSVKGNSGIFWSPLKSMTKAVQTAMVPEAPAGEMASPVPDDEVVRRNARRNAARRSAKSGRVSTFLSSDKMGG